MTFCGYNETMANGIQLFVEGMIEAMLARHSAGTSMEEVLRTELIDLATMNDALKKTSMRPDDLLNALVAINTFAQTIFSRSINKKFDADQFAKECRRSGLEFVKLVKATEERHLGELRSRGVRHGDAVAIEAVGKWLLQHADDVVDDRVNKLATV